MPLLDMKRIKYFFKNIRPLRIIFKKKLRTAIRAKNDRKKKSYSLKPVDKKG